LARTHPERIVPVQWHEGRINQSVFFSVDVSVEARDRQGLLRDISDVFTKEKINVIGVQTQSLKGLAWMTFTAEVTDAQRLQRVLNVLADVDGVIRARRK
jgi:GTP pyrophosphokinase